MKNSSSLRKLTSLKGSSIVEYGLLIGLIGLGTATAIIGMRGSITDNLEAVSSTLHTNLTSAVADNTGGASNPPDPVDQPVSLVFDGSSVRLYMDVRGAGATIDWGDGNETFVTTDGFHLHNYGVAGMKTVELSGELDNFKSETNNLVVVNSFGNVGLTSLYQTFYRDNDVQQLAPLPSTVTSINYAFFDAEGAMVGVENWDTSNITDMGGAFYSVNSFNRDLSNWDTTNVTVMTNMFDHDNLFTADLSGWCVSQFPSIPSSFGAPNATHPNWGAPC